MPGGYEDKYDNCVQEAKQPVIIKVMENNLVRLLDLYRGCDVSLETTPAVGEWLVIIK